MYTVTLFVYKDFLNFKYCTQLHFSYTKTFSISKIVHGYNEQGNLFPKYVSSVKPKNSAGDDLYLNMAGIFV